MGFSELPTCPNAASEVLPPKALRQQVSSLSFRMQPIIYYKNIVGLSLYHNKSYDTKAVGVSRCCAMFKVKFYKKQKLLNK